MTREEHELTLGNMEGRLLESGSSPRVDLGDVEEFDHGIYGMGRLRYSRIFKLSLALVGVKATAQEP